MPGPEVYYMTHARRLGMLIRLVGSWTQVPLILSVIGWYWFTQGIDDTETCFKLIIFIRWISKCIYFWSSVIANTILIDRRQFVNRALTPIRVVIHDTLGTYFTSGYAKTAWIRNHWYMPLFSVSPPPDPFNLNIRLVTPIRRGTVKTVNFLQYPRNRHPIAHPLGRGMGCLLWVWSLINVLLLPFQCCA